MTLLVEHRLPWLLRLHVLTFHHGLPLIVLLTIVHWCAMHLSGMDLPWVHLTSVNLSCMHLSCVHLSCMHLSWIHIATMDHWLLNVCSRHVHLTWRCWHLSHLSLHLSSRNIRWCIAAHSRLWLSLRNEESWSRLRHAWAWHSWLSPAVLHMMFILLT